MRVNYSYPDQDLRRRDRLTTPRDVELTAHVEKKLRAAAARLKEAASAAGFELKRGGDVEELVGRALAPRSGEPRLPRAVVDACVEFSTARLAWERLGAGSYQGGRR